MLLICAYIVAQASCGVTSLLFADALAFVGVKFAFTKTE
jgi:hypothetical protein